MLGLQTESRTAAVGVALLPAETVRSLMLDKRKVMTLCVITITASEASGLLYQFPVVVCAHITSSSVTHNTH